MKKHILSKYSETKDITENRESKSIPNTATGITETIEISDPDEFQVIGTTNLTFVIEDSDPDEFQ